MTAGSSAFRPTLGPTTSNWFFFEPGCTFERATALLSGVCDLRCQFRSEPVSEVGNWQRESSSVYLRVDSGTGTWGRASTVAFRLHRLLGHELRCGSGASSWWPIPLEW